jgi:lipoprotein-releasing system ATP-binding protein
MADTRPATAVDPVPSPADGTPILRLEGVRKSYGDHVVTEVLHGIDLVVPPGEFVALVGPSGAGKSTLLNLVGLLDRPTAGRIVLDGVDTSTLDDGGLTRCRGRRIGFVFQFHHLLPAFTALENVMMPLLVDRGRPDAEMRRRASALLDRVGLSGKVRSRASDLSGGEQQRVAVARALAMRPPLVLADEPTGNLDTHSADEVFALLREFNREFRSAFVVVTHDTRMAGRCDRVVEIVDGLIRTDRRLDPGGAVDPSPGFR